MQVLSTNGSITAESVDAEGAFTTHSFESNVQEMIMANLSLDDSSVASPKLAEMEKNPDHVKQLLAHFLVQVHTKCSV